MSKRKNDQRHYKNISRIRRNCLNIGEPEFNRRPKEGHGFIYRYIFKNGMSYIGQTVNTVFKRLKSHCTKGVPVDDIIRSGISFTVEIISEPKIEYLDGAEIYCISHFNTLYPNGYNMTNGGQRYKRMSDDSIRLLSESKKKEWIELEPQKKERKLKILEKARELVPKKRIDFVCLETGKIYHSYSEANEDLCPEYKMSSEFGHVLKGERDTLFGMHFALCNGYNEFNTEEIIGCIDDWRNTKKSFQAKRNMKKRYDNMSKRNEYKHNYMVRCLETGKLFQGAGHAAKEMGLNMELISQVCRGNKKTTGGFHFIIDTPYIGENCSEVLECLKEWEKEVKWLGYRKKSRSM